MQEVEAGCDCVGTRERTQLPGLGRETASAFGKTEQPFEVLRMTENGASVPISRSSQLRERGLRLIVERCWERGCTHEARSRVDTDPGETVGATGARS